MNKHARVGPSYVCTKCGWESFDPADLRMRFCQRCHKFADDAPALDLLKYLRFLKVECGYLSIRLLSSTRWMAVTSQNFAAAIVTGRIFDRVEIGDRWFYPDIAAAKAALEAWDGDGEPNGWHWHPASGRRRLDGDPAREYTD